MRDPLPHVRDVDLGKGYDPWGWHRKLKPEDTHEMVYETAIVIDYVEKHGPVHLWKMLNDLGKRAGPHKFQSRSERQKLIPLVTRLCREERLKRNRSTNQIALGPNHVPIREDIAAAKSDIGRTLRHVFGMDSLTAQ